MTVRSGSPLLTVVGVGFAEMKHSGEPLTGRNPGLWALPGHRPSSHVIVKCDGSHPNNRRCDNRKDEKWITASIYLQAHCNYRCDICNEHDASKWNNDGNEGEAIEAFRSATLDPMIWPNYTADAQPYHYSTDVEYDPKHRRFTERENHCCIRVGP